MAAVLAELAGGVGSLVGAGSLAGGGLGLGSLVRPWC